MAAGDRGFRALPLLGTGAAVGGAIGTWIGLMLLGRMKNRRFGQAFNAVLTLLALRLIWQALAGLGWV